MKQGRDAFVMMISPNYLGLPRETWMGSKSSRCNKGNFERAKMRRRPCIPLTALMILSILSIRTASALEIDEARDQFRTGQYAGAHSAAVAA